MSDLRHFGKRVVDYTKAPGTTVIDSERVEIYLDNIREKALEWIDKQVCVFGCLAWLTDPEIIRAINSKAIAQIVMQKEAWINGSLFTQPSGLSRKMFSLPMVMKPDSSISDSVERYRVFGISDDGPKPVMHHKFLVGCPKLPVEDGDEILLEPVSVWIGSYNMTKYAHRNTESALVLSSKSADVYISEWLNIFLNSESIGHSVNGCIPELSTNPTRETIERWNREFQAEELIGGSDQ